MAKIKHGMQVEAEVHIYIYLSSVGGSLASLLGGGGLLGLGTGGTRGAFRAGGG